MDSNDLPMSYTDTEINYSHFRFTSCIDWVRVKVRLARSTNFFTLKKHFNLSYVEGLDESSSHAATEFEFRVYDIKKWAELQECLDGIEKEFGYTQPPEITGVEVTFDAFSRANNHDELVRMAGHYYKFVARPFSKNRRFYNGVKGSPFKSSSIRHEQNLAKFNKGMTASIGSQGADGRTQRIYVKITDQKLPLNNSSDHRARYEVTLVGDECPFRTVQEATAFKFQSLAGYFTFRRLKPNLVGIMQIILKRRAHVGLVNPIRRRNGRLIRNNPRTFADSKLNAIAYDCLRNLTSRLKS